MQVFWWTLECVEFVSSKGHEVSFYSDLKNEDYLKVICDYCAGVSLVDVC